MYPIASLDRMYHPESSIKAYALLLELLNSYKEYIYDLINCNYYNIKINIASINWIGVFNSLNINKAVNIEKGQLLPIF